MNDTATDLDPATIAEISEALKLPKRCEFEVVCSLGHVEHTETCFQKARWEVVMGCSETPQHTASANFCDPHKERAMHVSHDLAGHGDLALCEHDQPMHVIRADVL